MFSEGNTVLSLKLIGPGFKSVYIVYETIVP